MQIDHIQLAAYFDIQYLSEGYKTPNLSPQLYSFPTDILVQVFGGDALLLFVVFQ